MSIAPAPAAVEPLFIEGAGGRLFAVHYRPRGPERGHLVLVAPFAEELNRCRRMIGNTARALADIGIGTFVLDLYGTGNSAGGFEEARWALWRNDVLAAVASLERAGHRCLGLWGVRLGGSLAAEIAAEPGAAIPHLLLWQPVPSGRTLLAQFLRVGCIAQLADETAGRADTKADAKGAREALEGGEIIEIAGYALSGALASAIERVSLADSVPGAGTAVDWIEFTARADEPLAPAKRRVADSWEAAGVTVRQTMIEAPSFWMIEEPVAATAPITDTVRVAAAWAA